MTPTELWEAHREYADNLAVSYTIGLPRHVRLDDMKQAARVGLWRAVLTYDQTKGQFKTHAWYYVRHELARERIRYLPWGESSYRNNPNGAFPAVESLNHNHTQIAESRDADSLAIRLIHRLTPYHQQWAYLFWIEGLPDTEAARRMGVSQKGDVARTMRKRILYWLKVIADQEC